MLSNFGLAFFVFIQNIRLFFDKDANHWKHGMVHQIASPISNQWILLTNIYNNFFFNWQSEKKSLFWTNMKFVFFFNCSVLSIKRTGCLTIPNVLIYITLYIRWVSVVEFHDWALSIGKVFGQESTVVKWNYQILSLHLVTVCQKVPILVF